MLFVIIGHDGPDGAALRPKFGRRISRICGRWSSGQAENRGAIHRWQRQPYRCRYGERGRGARFCNSDPYVTGGVFERVEVKPFRQGVSGIESSQSLLDGVSMAGALSSLKIVEVGEMVSAPYCSKLLADMGAEVVKIERPGVGDRARTRGPFPGRQTESRNERTVPLSQHQQARRHARYHASPRASRFSRSWSPSADILIHNVTPPEMDRVGLTYESDAPRESEIDHDVDTAVRIDGSVSRLPRRGSDYLVRGRRVRAQRRRPGASGVAAAEDRGAAGGIPGRSAWRDRDDCRGVRATSRRHRAAYRGVGAGIDRVDARDDVRVLAVHEDDRDAPRAEAAAAGRDDAMQGRLHLPVLHRGASVAQFR